MHYKSICSDYSLPTCVNHHYQVYCRFDQGLFCLVYYGFEHGAFFFVFSFISQWVKVVCQQFLSSFFMLIGWGLEAFEFGHSSSSNLPQLILALWIDSGLERLEIILGKWREISVVSKSDFVFKFLIIPCVGFPWVMLGDVAHTPLILGAAFLPLWFTLVREPSFPLVYLSSW